MKRIWRTSIAVTIGLAIVAALLVFLHIESAEVRQFSKRVDLLSLGMSRHDVLDTLRASPVYDYRYGAFRILYIRPPRGALYEGPEPIVKGYVPGAVVHDLHELPNIYNHIQLAFDSEDLLCAFTWIGESYYIKSNSGDVRGAHFSKLERLVECADGDAADGK